MSAPLAQIRFQSSQLLHIYAQLFINLLNMWWYTIICYLWGEKKMGEKMCFTGGAISCFLNIQSNPPGLSLSVLFSPQKLHGSPKTSHKRGWLPFPSKGLRMPVCGMQLQLNQGQASPFMGKIRNYTQKFLSCKNKQCHQFISSQTSTLLGKACRTFWWEKKYFGNTTSLLEGKLFLHSACLSRATLVHSSEECGWKRDFEVTRGRSWGGVAHSHFTPITPDQFVRSDPKLSPICR